MCKLPGTDSPACKAGLVGEDVCVRRLREGYEFFKSMAKRRSALEAAKAATA
jgi:hypothetical protein